MNRNKEIRIGFDINETLDNSIELLLECYNKKYYENIKFEDIHNYNIYNYLNPKCTDLFLEFIDDNFMNKVQLRKGFKDLVNWCYYDMNFTMRFVSSVHPEHFNYFYQFLKKHFDWIEYINVCRIPDKQFYDVDILVDDYYKNLIGGKYEKVLIRKPWNEHVKENNQYGIYIANNAKEIKEKLIYLTI